MLPSPKTAGSPQELAPAHSTRPLGCWLRRFYSARDRCDLPERLDDAALRGHRMDNGKTTTACGVQTGVRSIRRRTQTRPWRQNRRVTKRRTWPTIPLKLEDRLPLGEKL